MYLELRKVGAVGVLALLLLGPSIGNLFHVHEASHFKLCTHEGVVHFHAVDIHSTDCFLCSFSFAPLQENLTTSFGSNESIDWGHSLAPYLENALFLVLSPQHNTRAPPALYGFK